MFTIELYDLKFYSFHGFHDEERVIGNEYQVNVSVMIKPVEKISSIQQTVNYVTIYEAIKKRMQIPSLLLETLVEEMTEQIKTLDTNIKSINISIRKMHPPIKGIEGSVGVEYKKEF